MWSITTVEDTIGRDPSLSALRRRVSDAADVDPGHDVDHLLRVALWTLRLGGDEIDPRQAIAAALLHDLVNVPKDSPERAAAGTLSADQARTLLPACGFDDPAIRLIAEAIEDHGFSAGATPRSPLGRALQDADRLEALGALGIFRTISTGCRMGARYFDPDDPFAVERPLDDRAFTVDHFFRKLLRLADTMGTEAGRAEASRRTSAMVSFLEELAVELDTELPADRLPAQSQVTGRSPG